MGLTQVLVDELHRLSIVEVKEFAVVMSKTASNLYRLLENLLQWSRMQQGTIPFNPELLLLQNAIPECLAMELQQCNLKEIEIVLQIEEGITVHADRNLLQSTLRNLVSNALKFTHKGGKVILSAESAADRKVEISISDTGIGMSPNMIDNLFRIEVQTNRKGTLGEPSTGLGLLLCKEFIERHGGEIRVTSEVGKGRTFYFTMPQSQ
jgi:signal transduction histidine kinase